MAQNKILLSDNLTELDNIKSVVFKEAVNADVNIRPGCVGSASIEVEVYNTQANAVSAGDVVYYYQIDKNNTPTLIGAFTCEPRIQTKSSYKFIAYDNAQKLNADFSQWLQANQANFPMTIYSLVSAACTVAGVTLGSASWGLSTQNVQAFYVDGVTCRDILSYAAELGCCFVRCHTNGNVYFDWFSSSSNSIAPSTGVNQYAYKQNGLTYANFTTAALDRIAVHPAGEDDVAYIYPTAVMSGNTLHIQNNLLLTGADASLYNAVAQHIYTTMSSLGTYRPMTAELFAKENPFRAGDVVSVTDSQSVSFTSIITGMSVSNSGATLESTGYETYDEGVANTQKALTQLASDVVRINKLKVDWADINTAIINYLTANNVTAQNLSIVDENGTILATFDSSGITIGQTTESRAELDAHSFELIDENGNTYFSISDGQSGSGTITVTDSFVASDNQLFFYTSLKPQSGTINVYVNNVLKTQGTDYSVNNSYINFDLVTFDIDYVDLDGGDVVKIVYNTTDDQQRTIIAGRAAIGGELTVGGQSYFADTIVYDSLYGGNISADDIYSSNNITCLELTSDYITSPVTVENNSSPEIMIKNPEFDTSATPISNADEYGLYTFRDKNNRVLGYVQGAQYVSGTVSMRIRARRYYNGANVNHGVYMQINNTGVCSVSFDDVAAWRAGLGLGTDGAFPLTIAQGGTGATAVTKTTTTSSIISAASGVTVSTHQYAEWGKLAMVHLVMSKSSAVSGTNVSWGTMVSGKRPVYQTLGSWTSDGNGITLAEITSGGVVQTNGSLSANGKLYFSCVYLLA